jgi:hypothetical protein
LIATEACTLLDVVLSPAPGAGAPAESDEPAAGQAEEVLLDENKRREDGKHSFYMVRYVTCPLMQLAFCWCLVVGYS